MNFASLVQWPFKKFIKLLRVSLPDGFFALLGWILLIILGTWFPSTSVLKHIFEGDPLPKGIEAPSGFLEAAGLFCVSVVAWTWCNLAFICLASAYLGIAARPGIRTSDPQAWGQVLPRAFIVFLGCLLQELALRGGLIPSQERLGSGDAQQHYLRLAVLSSIACFAAAYRPVIFDKIIDKLVGQSIEQNSAVKGQVETSTLNCESRTINDNVAVTTEIIRIPSGNSLINSQDERAL